MIGFEKIYDWFVNVLCVLTVLFTFQFTASSVSASLINFSQVHHIGSSETYTYDETENSISAEVDYTGRLRRVLSKGKVGSDGEVLGAVTSVAARGGAHST